MATSASARVSGHGSPPTHSRNRADSAASFTAM